MKVSEWISQHPKELTTCLPTVMLKELIDIVIRQSPCTRDIYIVSDEEELLGHLTSKKLLELYLLEHQPTHTRRQIIERVTESTAKELMERNFPTANLDEELDSVLDRQLEHDLSEMVVIDDEGKLCGAIDLLSVVRSLRNFELTETSSI